MKTIKNLKAEEIRKSILQLAIQGKLVKQDPNDEPASELVKRIYAEKQKLIKEGKIKKDKNESFIFKGDDNCYYEKIGNNEPVKLDDLPFDIPDSWIWVRLKDIINIQTGASFKKENSTQEAKDGHVRVLRGGNILPFQYLLKSDDLYIPQSLVSNDILLRKNDLITPAVTSLENIGKIAVIDAELSNVTAGGFVYIFRPYISSDVISNLIADFVSSSAYQTMMKDITKKSGQAFYNMNKEKLLQLYFPVAPLGEMKRIVEKVNKCVPLVAEYSLIEEKLTKLEGEFSDKLKKSILQYAIEGKLVKQDPNDEPASVLLERIKAEKEKLIKEGKIKRDKNESYIYQGDDKNYYEKVGTKISMIDIPFALPAGYSWSRLKTICTKLVDGNHNPPEGVEYKTNYLMLSSQNVNNDEIVNLDKVRFLSKDQFIIEDKRTALNINDILFTSVGTLGRSCIYKGGMNLCFQRSVSVITTLINHDYLKMYLDSPSYQSNVIQQASGTAQKGFYLNQLGNSLIAIPSENQMKLVVEKVKKIIRLL